MAQQPDRPNNMLVTLYLVVSAIFTFFIVVIVYIYMKADLRRENHLKVELAPTVELDTLRNRETQLLGQGPDGRPKNTYQVVDAAKGIYRIPIERAMELETQDSWRHHMPPPEVAQTTATTANAKATTQTTPAAH